RELAPISDSAWAQIEEETSRTLKRYLAGRRVVDLKGPAGTGLSAVGTGHLRTITAPAKGILARQREVKALVELRIPFELDRKAIDDVDRGATDCFRRGRRNIRWLCRRQHRGHSSGDQQSDQDTSRRCTRVPGCHCPELEPVASRRCQRTLFSASRGRRLHRTRRD